MTSDMTLHCRVKFSNFLFTRRILWTFFRTRCVLPETTFLLFRSGRRKHIHGAMYRASWHVMAVQGRPKSLTLVLIESPYANSY